MHILINARVKTTYMVGDMSVVGVEGWYHSEGIANNLSVALINICIVWPVLQILFRSFGFHITCTVD